MKNQEKIYDFIVIGAGFAGLSSAYYLAMDGYSVLVLDRNDGHNNASSNSTAMLSHDPDADWDMIISQFGIEGARKVVELSEKALALFESYSKKSSPHVVVNRVPAIMFARSKTKSEQLVEQYETYRKIGLKTEFIREGSAVHKSFHSVLTISREAQTNNWSLLNALARSVRTHGGKIIFNLPVTSVSEERGLACVATGKEIFYGKQAIVTSGDQNFFPKLDLGIKAKRTFALTFEKHGGLPKLFTSSMMWDNEKPYHYIRAFRGYKIWVGGEDVMEKNYDPKKDYYPPLEVFAREVLGFDKSYKRTSPWNATFFPTQSGLPVIAHVPDMPVIMNVGFGGTGILTSFISGYLLASWLKKKELMYKPLFGIPSS